MNMEYYEKQWQALELKDLHSQQIFWDSRAEEFNKGVFKKENIKNTNNAMNFLISKIDFNKDSEILDIGCGPGKYSVQFSKLVEKVTALDISPEMIRYAKGNAEQQNIKNIDFQLCPWEMANIQEKGWSKKFDLVFASMCPGINSKDALMKMIEASKGYCFMSSFAKRKDKIMDSLSEEIYNEKSSSRWGKNIYYAFNILWSLGYYPEICYQDVKIEKVYTLEKAIELYTHQIQTNKEEFNDVLGKTKKYLTNIAEDGMIKDIMEAKIAWIYWKK
ncbi:MAG: class I SAM-dependent methyltransferase [Clostridium sp.]|uniref:class I SAM-dependent methyltransferase n=1 Tax=Clostridium sp. TaxID=1506 RepID=UPI003D6CD44A